MNLVECWKSPLPRQCRYFCLLPGEHTLDSKHLHMLGVKQYSDDLYSEPLICILQGKFKYVLEGADDIQDCLKHRHTAEN